MILGILKKFNDHLRGTIVSHFMILWLLSLTFHSSLIFIDKRQQIHNTLESNYIMTRDKKIRTIGAIIMFLSVIIMGYVMFIMKKSVAFSAISGLLMGMGLVLFTKGESIVDKFKKKRSSQKTN